MSLGASRGFRDGKARRYGGCSMLASVWCGWGECLHIVRPETVFRWQRQGFRYYWRWTSRGPRWAQIDPEIRGIAQRMCRANPLWGAPRIYGELVQLGTLMDI